MTKPIDYSKWNDIDSDIDSPEPSQKNAPPKAPEVSKPVEPDVRLTFEEAMEKSYRPSGDEDVAEIAGDQMTDEVQLEALYYKLKSDRGVSHEDTLTIFFKLFDVWIGLYRLNKCDKELEEVVPVCKERAKDDPKDTFYIKGIQALAFTRWKQSRLRESVALFHEMENIVGGSAALCENIGHTYSSMGDLAKAEEYFKKALEFINTHYSEEEIHSESNKGGVLLGLGLILDRSGKAEEALPVCLSAHEFYKKKFEKIGSSSLIAKSGMSVAECYKKLGQLEKSLEHARECVQIFEVTCGVDSPLTGSALKQVGTLEWQLGRREAARDALDRALYIHAIKDALDIIPLMEIHSLIVDTHTKPAPGGQEEGLPLESIDRSLFKRYRRSVDTAVRQIQKVLAQDGNAAVYYKLAAEMFVWMADYARALELVEIAIPLFRDEKSMDCSSFVEQCTDLRSFIEENMKKAGAAST